MKRKTQITMTVTLDEKNTPEAMEWSAPDGGVKEPVSYTHLRAHET